MFKGLFGKRRNAPEPEAEPTQNAAPVSEESAKLATALGGGGNIVSSQPIAETRLLVKLRDNAKIDTDGVRAMGLNVFIPREGGDVHILTGLNPERFTLK